MKQRETREQGILKELKENNRVYVSDMSAKYNVSEVTIRKDLIELEKNGKLKRIYGGAQPPENVAMEPEMASLIKTNMDAKRRIAKKAFQMIAPRDAILIDASSTLGQLVVEIQNHPEKPLTVITSSVAFAATLAGLSHVELIMLGGHVRGSINSVMGPIAMETLKTIHADKAFIGTSGIDLKKGFTTQNIFECEVKRTMIDAAAQSFVLADKSKINRVALGNICPMGRVDYLITDFGFPENMIEAINKTGTDVIVVSEEDSQT